MRNIVYKENRRHGIPEFPIQFYRIDSDHPRYSMPLHWHREFEIVRVISGNLKLFLNNTEYLITAGDIAFIGCGILHRGQPKSCVYECIVLDLNMLCRHATDKITKYILPIITRDIEVERIIHSADRNIINAVGSLFDTVKKESPFFELKVYSCISEIIYLLYAENKVKAPEKGRSACHAGGAVTDLLDYIEHNYTEKITLEELSKVANTNEKYLCRFFKEYTGNTPIEYINRLRIERACLKMTEESKSITEAAFDSGFNDISYFSKIFKKYKGITPREYRRIFDKTMTDSQK